MVRFDLTNNTGTDRLYLDESQLVALRKELRMWDLHDGTAGAHAAPYRVVGTASCWMPHDKCPAAGRDELQEVVSDGGAIYASSAAAQSESGVSATH